VPGTKSYIAKTGNVDQEWWIVDAEGLILGRLASEIAVVLMGKHRPTYTPHVDTGDFVIVTNVEKLAFTGNKLEKKMYTWYTGYPGLRSETAKTRFERKPEQVLRDAVRRMLPKNRLGRQMLNKLKIYQGVDHPHQAQNAKTFESSAKK
jgi:large subunit ribosomal protein L13